MRTQNKACVSGYTFTRRENYAMEVNTHRTHNNVIYSERLKAAFCFFVWPQFCYGNALHRDNINGHVWQIVTLTRFNSILLQRHQIS